MHLARSATGFATTYCEVPGPANSTHEIGVTHDGPQAESDQRAFSRRACAKVTSSRRNALGCVDWVEREYYEKAVGDQHARTPIAIDAALDGDHELESLTEHDIPVECIRASTRVAVVAAWAQLDSSNC